jgi:hypothetical protein
MSMAYPWRAGADYGVSPEATWSHLAQSRPSNDPYNTPKNKALQNGKLTRRVAQCQIIDSRATICECFALRMKVFNQASMLGKLYKFLFGTGNLRFKTAASLAALICTWQGGQGSLQCSSKHLCMPIPYIWYQTWHGRRRFYGKARSGQAALTGA